MATGTITHIYKRATRDATSRIGIIGFGDKKTIEFNPKHVAPDLLADADAERNSPPVWGNLKGKDVEFELVNGEIKKGTLRKRK